MTKFNGTSDRYLEITSALAAQNLGPRSLAGLMFARPLCHAGHADHEASCVWHAQHD